MVRLKIKAEKNKVAPARERGLKYAVARDDSMDKGRSREGAWIEIPTLERLWPYGYSRSREGAWIEILKPGIGADYFSVAPARERGLKFEMVKQQTLRHGRSREGAWIEIALV